jgi:2-isopropylmalate synthase
MANSGGGHIDSKVEVLDSTLREGSQAHGISFTLQDKLGITERLDELGVRFIEGGWPGSNPKDLDYFRAVKKLSLAHSEVVAFGSTRRKNTPPGRDGGLNRILESEVKTAVIFGKSWTLHIEAVLRTSREENLRMVAETIEYLREHGLEVIFDAEHFFDGFRENPEYALQVLEAAQEAGARTLVLCDTNGGTLTQDLRRIFQLVKARVKAPLGIHCHNDMGLAVANTLEAVGLGAGHIQVTVNGLGERCGNADLCVVVPTLVFKMGLNPLEVEDYRERVRLIPALSAYVYELLNLPANPYQPYVGRNAFAHKGGVHIDAMLKHPRAYEHIDPALVGNTRATIVSELAGKSALIAEGARLGLDLKGREEVVRRVLEEVKRLEAEGYQFENAKASVHLLLLRELGYDTRLFETPRWQVSITQGGEVKAHSWVLVRFKGGESWEEAEGVGPVHALDLALRKALLKRFPELESVRLVNYKVTVVDSVEGTGSKVRVFIEFEDNGERWATTSASPNIIWASADALTQGYTYRLLLSKLKGKAG